MAKIDIPHLVIKRRGVRLLHYWQPSATLRDAGWESTPLGTDPRAAQAKAQALNDKVSEWREGGPKPRLVRSFIAAGTMTRLIMHFLDDHVATLAPNTQKEYKSKLGIIQRWAGKELVIHIDRARVRKLKEVLLKPDAKGVVKKNRAAGTMRILHTLLGFAIDNGYLPENTVNPASNQRMPQPAPRDQVWSPEAVDTLSAEVSLSLECGIHLGREIGQREADLLALSQRQWVIIPQHKLGPSLWEQLAEPEEDGTRTVRGMRLRQGKTKRWIEVPVVGATRRLVERCIGAARAANSTLILIDEETRTGWTATRFQRAIADRRATCAAAARKAGDAAFAAELEGLQFRDLRRTAVVWLGELGIEDHLIAAITGHTLDETRKILETYMPRTTKMAGRAIALRVERDHGETDARAKG